MSVHTVCSVLLCCALAIISVRNRWAWCGINYQPSDEITCDIAITNIIQMSGLLSYDTVIISNARQADIATLKHCVHTVIPWWWWCYIDPSYHSWGPWVRRVNRAPSRDAKQGGWEWRWGPYNADKAPPMGSRVSPGWKRFRYIFILNHWTNTYDGNTTKHCIGLLR